MTIIDEYLEYQDNTEKIWKKSIVIMEVGHFLSFMVLNSEENSIGILHEIADILIQVTRKNKSVLEVSRGNPYMAEFLVCFKKTFNSIITSWIYCSSNRTSTPPPNPKKRNNKNFKSWNIYRRY